MLTVLAGLTMLPTGSASAADRAAGPAAVAMAATRAGDPYEYGADGPDRFDCSGLVRWVYAHLGTTLPHSSAAQYRQTRHLDRRDARAGDLVFFFGSGGAYHVGIYAGDGQLWHAPEPGRQVTKEHLWTTQVRFGRVPTPSVNR